MYNRCRFLWNRLSRLRNVYKFPTMSHIRQIPLRSIVFPYTLGFSVFTWLGEDKKLSAEDELINTIKHCVLFIQRGEYDKAEQLLHVALRQAQQMQHQLAITYIYDVMANLALEREQLDKAKQLFVSVAQRIMSDGAKEDDPRMIHISTKLARISHLKKEYATAQIGFNWCLEKLKGIPDTEDNDATKKLLAMAKDWYGRLFVECGQSEQGLLLMVSALDLMRQLADVDKEHIAIQLNDIGTVCDKLERIDESIKYFNEAIITAKEFKMEELGTMYVNLGKAYLKKSMLDEARKLCGYGWKLGVTYKNNDTKREAENCIKEVIKIY